MPFGVPIHRKCEEKDVQVGDFVCQLEISPAYRSRTKRGIEKPPKDELTRKTTEILGVSADDVSVETSRLPLDIRDDVGSPVRMYCRNVTGEK